MVFGTNTQCKSLDHRETLSPRLSCETFSSLAGVGLEPPERRC